MTDSFSDLPSKSYKKDDPDFQEMINLFHKRVEYNVACHLKFNPGYLQGMGRNNVRERALLYMFSRSSDMGLAYSIAIPLTHALVVMARSLLEIVFWAKWIIDSDKNAALYEQLAKNRLTIIARVGLRQGHVFLVDSQGEYVDHSKVEAFSTELEKAPAIEQIAKQTGLVKLYDLVYRSLSAYEHGNMFGLSEFNVSDHPAIMDVSVSLEIASGAIQCINLLGREWIVESRRVTAKEILDIMKIP